MASHASTASGATNGWVWYPATPSVEPPPAPVLSYRGAPQPDFGDDLLSTALTTVRDPSGSRAAAVPTVGSSLAEPVLAPRPRPDLHATPRRRRPVLVPLLCDDPETRPPARIVARPIQPNTTAREVELRSVYAPPGRPMFLRSAPGPASRAHTFEFLGTAANVGSAKSIIASSLQYQPPIKRQETMLRTGPANVFMLLFSLAFVAATLAYVLASEISIGVERGWSLVTAVLG